MNIAEKLRAIYSPDQGWALYTEIRSSTGGPSEGLRIADAVAVSLWPSMGLEVRGFELKESRADWLRELRAPQKAREVGRFCSRWSLVVPAPWKKIVLSLEELPEGWGLIEVGTGEPLVVRDSEERAAVDPTPAFLQSLLRAGARGSTSTTGGAPEVRISRPHLSRHHVGLACGHIAPTPLAKKMPDRTRCWSCAEGRPPDVEIARAVIAEADPSTLRLFVTDIEGRIA